MGKIVEFLLTSAVLVHRTLNFKRIFTFAILHFLIYFLEGQIVSAVSNVSIEKLYIFSKIQYRYGRTKIFCEMHNQASKAEEVSFAMFLPQSAFVSSFSMEIDGEFYKSFVKEKGEANNDYLEARKNGHGAGIINEDANLFNISINLEAQKAVIFHLEYEEEVIQKSGHYEHSISVIPQDMDTKHLCVDVDIIDFKNFTISALNLCSSSCVTVDLEKEAMVLQRNREKRIIWEPSLTPGKMEELQRKGVLGRFKITYAFTEPETINEVLIDNGYILHRFSPRHLPTIPLHLIFILDISASMMDQSHQRHHQLTHAMSQILDDLKDHDYFSIVTFSTESTIWRPYDKTVLPAWRKDVLSIQSAKNKIRNLTYKGSTNIYAALMDGLEIAKQSSATDFNDSKMKEDFVKPSPMIIFLTDGTATSGIIDPSIILEKVREKNNITVPIFSLAFGSSADYSLLQNLSRNNYGIARRIFDNVNAVELLKDFYDLVGSPVLRNLTFTYKSDWKIVDLTSEYEPWLSVRGEISVAGRIEHDHLASVHSMNVTVRGEGSNSTALTFNVVNCGCGPLNLCSGNPAKLYDQTVLPHEQNPNIDRKCGRGVKNDEEVSFLERFWVHKELKKFISQFNAGNGSVKTTILELALKYKLVTPFTSLVAITPYDDILKSHKKIVNGQSIGKLMNRDIGLMKTIGQKPKYPKTFVNFSNSNAPVFNSTVKRETLNVYLQRLISEQVSAKHDMERLTSLKAKLTLEDIQWLNSTAYKLVLLNHQNNQSYNFKILTKQEKPLERLSNCSVAGGRQMGRCTHLLNCVQTEFLNNRTLFVKNYFCPLSGNFVGTCCTDN